MNPTESAALTAMRSFLLSFLPSGVEVVKSQSNRVPEPISDDFVTMTPQMRTRLATNIDRYDGSAGEKHVMQATQLTIQLDFHGPRSGDNSQAFTTLWRDEYASDFFSANPITLPGGVPTQFNGSALYSSDPHQLPFVNGEMQYEDRWSVDAEMQINPIVTVPQQFAKTVTLSVAEVDATFPP
jgi:hypothetical protein